MTTTIRIIKKYPNRRLYDTEISTYVTLDDIKKLVLQNIHFQVIDAKSQEDLTNNTLLQIITELEQHGAPIFTSAILQQLIRFYGNPVQNTMSKFLEQSIGLFNEQQKLLQEQMSGLLDKHPLSFYKDLSEKQMHIWQSLFDNFRQGYSMKREENKTEQEKPNSNKPTSDDKHH